MDGRRDRRTDGQRDGGTDGQMEGWIDGWITVLGFLARQGHSVSLVSPGPMQDMENRVLGGAATAKPGEGRSQNARKNVLSGGKG